MLQRKIFPRVLATPLVLLIISGCKLTDNSLITDGDSSGSTEPVLTVESTTNNDWISLANQSTYQLQGECEGISLISFTSSDISSFDVPCNDGQWSATIDFTGLDASSVELEIDGSEDGEVLQTLTYSLNKYFEPTEVFTKVGQGVSGSADGVGTLAQFSNVTGITSDGTYLYVADAGNRIIKRVNVKTLEAVTIAGMVGVSGSVNGPALSSTFNNIKDLTYHNGYLYIADYNTHLIRRLNLATSTVDTFAGDGVAATLDGVGTAARFNGPAGLVSDGTYIWVTERGNRVLRRITIATGEVLLVAGQPGSAGFTDGIGTAARLHRPEHLVSVGNYLYIVEDFKNHVRRVNKTTFEVTTFAGHESTAGVTNGIGTAARFNGPIGISTDGEYLYVVEKFNRRIRKITISTAEVADFAGTGVASNTDGALATATMNGLFSSFYFSNHIYFSATTMLRAIH